jgi:uncharacterized protein
MSDVLTDAPAAQAQTNPHGSFIWYELITPDPEAAKSFYEHVVGWTVEDDGTGYPHLKAGQDYAGGMLALTDEMRAHGARPVWLGYVGVDDVDSTVEAAVSDGGRVLMAARDMPNVGRFALLADPDGAPFYVMRGAQDERSCAFSTDQPQHVRWNELSTSDPQGAVAFYGKHFGWAEEGGMDMGEMGLYRFINHDGVMIGAIMPRMAQMPVSLWTYYFGVDDIDRAAGAIEERGGKILNGPMEIPGGEYALNAMDPQGAAFGLVGPRR